MPDDFSIKLLLQYFLAAFASLLVMVDPIGTVPTFIAITAGMAAGRRNEQARRACIYAAIILIIALFFGSLLLQFFGISLAALRVAGGIIVAFIGFNMLFPPEHRSGEIQPEGAGADLDYALIPLAIPGLAGAGAMAVIVSFSTKIAVMDPVPSRIALYVSLAAAVLAVMGVTCIVLLASQRLSRLLGSQGLNAVTRLMGMILVCIGVQFVADGVREFIRAA